MPHRYPELLTAALLLALAAAAAAQPPPAETPAATTAAPEPPPNGFRDDYLKELARLERRTLALARAFPAERWAEPPGPEIHSFGECLAALAAASRRTLAAMEREVPPAPADGALPAAAGGEPPSAKDRQIAELTAVLAAARRAVEETPDDGLAAPIDFLGRRWTVRGLFLLLLGQTHEGLGHAAALAEVLGSPPPWVKLRRAAAASSDD